MHIGTLGFLGACTMGMFMPALMLAAVGGAIGFVWGLLTWGFDVPPRWFWSRSRLDLMDNRIMGSFSTAFAFACAANAFMWLMFI